MVEDALGRFYPKHIDSAPAGSRDDLEVTLLLAVWIAGSGVYLFGTNRASVIEIDRRWSIGYGSYLTEYLLDALVPPGATLSVGLAKPLAAYIVGMAKRYINYCGGKTYVRALREDGYDERVWQQEVNNCEKYICDFFKSVGLMFDVLGAMPSWTDSDIGIFTQGFERQLKEFKENQKIYDDRRTRERTSRRPQS